MPRGLNNFCNRGFTLIEVLVALSLTVVAVTGASSIVAKAYKQVAITAQLQRAHHRAASHLASLDAKPLVAGVQHGVYPPADGSFNGDAAGMEWTLVLTPITATDLAPEVKTMTNRVVAMQAELEVVLPDLSRQVHLSTIVFSLQHQALVSDQVHDTLREMQNDQ
ncbi:type IV pilus modification PilV family protein [Arenicella xantha]|uniref:Prepilin-type N-terminal cleavage/methylation domain-containing protein n=1 Tax=Arenicella xantha TaxID=644221 RepID=A0A395JEN6_9GAMM|nr:prepilin-type N-terminal cleavage/methylation domain-containing protein [Arenicella xantha]RBP47143.1 prepilin-type N-terminal cleavage/methylation domain-containing protein [Arenicella xantha]